MIPAELRALKGWLLWRLVQMPGEPKPRKLPHYVSGGRRQGKQGSPEDRAKWATYDEAARELAASGGRYAGLGLAMSPDWGIVGLDFDACVSGGVVDAQVMDVIAGTYSEMSPSGTGVHAFLVGALPDRKSRAGEAGAAWGFETFCEKGFLTMTGQPTPACELVGWDSLDHVNGVVSELFEQRFGGVAAVVTGAGESTGAVLGLSDDDLRALLKWHDPDAPYQGSDMKAGSWLGVGMALHHETGGDSRGLELWDTWSQGGVKYPGPELLTAKWASFGAAGGGREVTAGWLRMVAEVRSAGEVMAGDFDVIEDDRPPAGAVFQTADKVTSGSGVAPGRSEHMTSGPVPATVRKPRVKRKGIPEAHYLTTDLANAQRLKGAFGNLVFVAAGRWFVWDGKRWAADESDVYRYGSRLSELIREEAKPFRARAAEAEAAGNAAEAKVQKGVADALEKWAKSSEMKATIEAAVGLARKMLTLDPGVLDADPWALNCENGIVDLRTGRIRRHDPAEYITKLVPLRYVPEARCDRWEKVLREIVGGSGAVAAYLQRWFGYCLTGDTREQCFVVHWGGGSNGKSTVLDLMADTMGDYATTAAPGLMMATKGDRHPTEIAALFGRRMVTAHESGEGTVLREDFIKQATGGDRITARFMREDFFEFPPTHKLQLLTNHKPAVKGQDMGIWRRVMLVPYTVTFGTVDEVLEGSRMAVKDMGLSATLRDEMEGILAWRVRGAVDWALGGLQPPGVVLAASASYKTEQDRVGQFVAECCDVGAEWSEPLTEGMGGGLYPAYVSWCRDAGIHPVSKLRFMDDIVRVVPGAVTLDRKRAVGDGKQRRLKMVLGVRLLPD